MKNLTSKAGLIGFGTAVFQVFTILSTLVLARILTQEDLGTYKQVFLVNNLIVPIFAAGVPAGIFYFLPRLKQEKDKKLFISRSIGLLFLLGLSLGVAVSLSSFLVPKIMHNEKLTILLVIFGLYAFGHLAVSFFEPVLVVYNRLKALFIYPMVYGAASFIIIVGLALLFDGDLKAVVTGVSLASLVFFIFALVFTKTFLSLRKTFSFNLESYKSQLAYGVPLGLTSIIGLLAWEFDKLVVSVNFSPELYAVYVLGATEIPFVSMIRGSVTKVILPEMVKVYAEGNLKELVRLWHSSIRKISLIILPIFVVAMIFSHEIITILYSEKFSSSVPFFRIYLFLLIIRVASYGIILQAIGKTRENLKGSIFFFIANGILNVVLVSTLGLIGPATATVLATFLSVIYYIVVIKGCIRFSFSDMLPWLVILRNFVLAIVAAVALIPGFYSNLPALTNVILSTILYAFVYIFLITKFGVFTRDDKELLRSYFVKTLVLLKRARQH
ncbi:MAG TPA: oligosaccharide flippase family protein [Candidatus Nanoarchaeia archaeon]